MATIVIVHGGYHGGWRWKEVRLALQAAGHEVYSPTLTGLGERVHLATPEVGLDIHILDVANVLEYEDLRDVVPVGHSYGGMMITAVAERAAARLARLVYLDALLPRDGECLLDVLTPEGRAEWEAQPRLDADGWRIAPASPHDWRSMPMPLKTFRQPLRLTGSGGTVPEAFVHCTEKPGRRPAGEPPPAC
jgi:pimeloyl-ACP methyl ester carboxylesterase